MMQPFGKSRRSLVKRLRKVVVDGHRNLWLHPLFAILVFPEYEHLIRRHYRKPPNRPRVASFDMLTGRTRPTPLADW